MEGCLVAMYGWWWTLEENFWQNELEQTGQDPTWHEWKPISRGEGTSDTWKEILRRGQGQKYSSSLIVTLSTHSQARQHRQEPLDTNSSKTHFWNMKYTDLQIQGLCNYSLILQNMNQLYLYKPHKYNETRRTSPWAAFDKVISDSGRSPL